MPFDQKADDFAAQSDERVTFSTLPLSEEVRAWVEVCDAWGSWHAERGPSARDLKGVSACLNRLLDAFRTGGEYSFYCLSYVQE